MIPAAPRDRTGPARRAAAASALAHDTRHVPCARAPGAYTVVAGAVLTAAPMCGGGSGGGSCGYGSGGGSRAAPDGATGGWRDGDGHHRPMKGGPRLASRQDSELV